MFPRIVGGGPGFFGDRGRDRLELTGDVPHNGEFIAAQGLGSFVGFVGRETITRS